ncbi:hypothetical protein MAR_022485 [Mya arenaria]|uniref:Mitochondria-eating protein C-terminal domain-containing protein n=1 Tax=Mya arenaria TaxID=6604 RepID=A0ABY7DK66_MYAAR|nr:hypothetical protein MAR_022485 [Mya arenaria]
MHYTSNASPQSAAYLPIRLYLADCWECLNIIFTWFRLIKCVKFLRDCLKFKNKPEYQYRRLSSIKIDRDETGETVHRLREEIEHKDNKIHELQEQNRKTALDKRHAEVSFTFCKTELEANWQLVSKWYLDDKLYTLLCGLCKLESLQFVLSSCQMKEYVATCVKLSLLMNANDPPVAIECPGWVPCISQKESIYQPKHEEESDLLTHEGNAQIPTNVDGDGSNQTYTSDLKERRTFNKELFKEYTVRGKYVEFFVWPVMYLHENGPVLAKGIAQGAEDKVISDDDHRWVWW